MKIDAEHFFTNRSIIRKDVIFAHMFKLAPSVYACTLDEEGKKIDMYNANKKTYTVVLSKFGCIQ